MAATIHRQTVLHQGRSFRFVKENVTLENGATVDLEISWWQPHSAVERYGYDEIDRGPDYVRRSDAEIGRSAP